MRFEWWKNVLMKLPTRHASTAMTTCEVNTSVLLYLITSYTLCVLLIYLFKAFLSHISVIVHVLIWLNEWMKQSVDHGFDFKWKWRVSGKLTRLQAGWLSVLLAAAAELDEWVCLAACSSSAGDCVCPAACSCKQKLWMIECILLAAAADLPCSIYIKSLLYCEVTMFWCPSKFITLLWSYIVLMFDVPLNSLLYCEVALFWCPSIY